MKHWLSAALALWLAGAACAVAADREEPADEAEVVHWPLPWDEGRTLVYDDSYLKTTRTGDTALVVRGQGTTFVEAVREADGYRQRWRSEDLAFDASGLGDAGMLMASAARAMEGVVTEARLDGEGTFVELANVEEVALLYRGMLREMFGGILSQLPEEANAQEMRALLEGMADRLSVPAVLAVSLAETPHAYNFVAKGGLGPDLEYHYEDEGLTPFGNAPLKRDNRIVLSAAADAPGRYDLRWTIDPDPESLRAALVAAFESIMTGMPELQEMGAEAFAGSVEMRSTIDYRIDAATGIVQRMQRVTRKRFGDRDEEEVSTLTLRE